MNVNINIPVNIEALNFTGDAFSGSTGYTLSSNNGNGLTIVSNQHAVSFAVGNMPGSIFIQDASTYSGTGITDTIAAPITIATGNGLWLGNYTPTSANNLLSVTGDISNSVTAGVAVLGVGNTSISGNITDGGGAQSVYIDTAGGVTTLSGNNTYSGGTNILNGNLVLDYTSNNTDKIGATGGLSFGEPGGSGSLQLLGNSSAATSQSVSGLTLNGAGTINLVSGTNQNVTLSVGAITRNRGGTLDLELNPNGSGVATFNTTATNDATGILGGWATVGENDWATSTAGTVTAYSGYTNDTWASGNNTTVTGNDSISSSTTNSLRFADTLNPSGDTVTLSGANTITSGGILDAQSAIGPMAITGGSLTSGNGTDLIVNQFNSSALTISSQITGAIGLTKSGSGTLVLSGNNNFTGTVYLNQGTLQAGSNTALGSLTNNLVMGGSSVFDLNGNNIQLATVNSDQNYGLNGSASAAAGLNSSITNNAAGTISTLTVGVGGAGSSFYGGFNEASGAILDLNVSQNGVFNIGGTGYVDRNANSGTQYNGQAIWSDTVTGSINVATGAVLNLQGDGALRTWGAFTVNGSLEAGVPEGRNIPVFASTYLNGKSGGNVTTVNFNYFNQSFAESWLNIDTLGSVADTYSGAWNGGVTPIINGTGTVVLPAMNAGNTNVSNLLVGSTGTLITPSAAGASELIITGGATLKITGSDTTPGLLGSPLPQCNYNLQGGTLWIAPSIVGDGSSPVSVSAPFNPFSAFQYQGTTVLLDRGSNAGLVFNEGQPLARESAGTMIIGATDGFAGLGTTEQFNLTYNGLTSSNGVVNALPPVTNGIVAPNIVGQDDSVGSTKSGTFLTYVNSGTTTFGGFTPYAYTGGTTNNLAASNINTVEDVTSAGTPQSLTGDTAAYALQVDGAGTPGSPIPSVVALNGHTLTLGSGGLILNGGMLNGGTLTSSSGEFDIYASDLNGAVSSNLTGNSFLVKFGPGVLTLSGANSYTGSTNINNGALDVGTINGTSGISLTNGVINFNGGVLQGNGTFTRSLGGGGDQVDFLSGGAATAGGGFAARGGSLTVTIGGTATPTQLGWGQTYGNFIADGAVLYFGSTTADSTVNLTNNLDLGLVASNSALPVFADSQITPGTGYLDRVISVQASLADTGGNANGALTIDAFNATDVAVLSGTISSSDPYHILSKDGNGVLELTGNNTYTGATAIANGVLIVSSDANLGIAPTAAYALNTSTGYTGGAATPGAVIINSGATLATDTSFTLNGNRTILLASGTSGLASSASNIEVAGIGTTLNFGGIIGNYINEAGTLNKTGAGTFVFSGTGLYTGATVISGGTFDLQGTLNNSVPLATSQFTTGLGGTGTALTFQGAGGTFNYDYANSHPAANTPLNPTIFQQNMGALTVDGGDATVISSLGATNITNGNAAILQFSSLTANTANGATLNFVADGTVVASGGGGGTTNNSIIIQGQTLDANNSAIITSQGAPDIGVGSFIGQTGDGPTGFQSDANVYFNGSNFAYYDTQGYVRGIAWGSTRTLNGPGDVDTLSTSAAFDNTSQDNYGFAIDQYGYVQVTGGGSIVQTSLDNVSITGLNMIDGTTLDLNGTTLSVNGILASLGGTEVITDGILTTSYGNTLTVRTDTSSDILEIDGTVADSLANGSIALTKSGAGTLLLTGTNTYSGGTVISGGTLQIGNGGTTGTAGSGAVLDNATLAFDRSDVSTFGNAISGVGGIAQIGTGTTDLTAAETYTGPTAIQNGTLELGATGSLSPYTTIVLGDAVTNTSGVLMLGDAAGPTNITLASLNTVGTGTANAVVGGNAAVSNLTVDNTTTNTYSGVLGGTGANENNLSLTKLGEGTLVLNGNSTYTGGTAIDEGTISLGAANALGTSGPISFGGGTLQFTSANTTDYSSRIANSTGQITIDTNGQNVTFAGTIDSTNTGGLGKEGAGTLTLTGSNSFTGVDSILDGTLSINSTAALGNSDAILIGNATLQYTGATGTLTQSIQSIAGDAPTITATGTGTGNTLSLSGPVNIQGTTLTLNTTSGNTINVGGVISGNDGTSDSNLNITGAGVTILSNGGNSYLGTTLVNGGTLGITTFNTNVLGNSSLLLENQGALQFIGTGGGGFPNFIFSNTINVGTGGGSVVINGEDEINGPIIGPGNTLNVSGNGDFLYQGGVSNIGTIDITGARVLMFGNTLNLLANNTTVNVASTGTLDFGTTNGTVTNLINLASGSFLDTRGGNYIFTNVNLPTAGIITLGSDDVGGGSFVINGNALNLTGDLTLAVAGANGGNTTLVTLGMNIGGSGGLIDSNGTGNATRVSALILSGTNTYSGATTITNGGFVDFNGNETGIGSTINVQNGSLQIGSAGSIASTANITLGSGSETGVLYLGDGAGGINLTLSQLTAAGNNLNGDTVLNGGSASGSTLTFDVTGTSSTTYGGAIGNGNANQNLVTVVKDGTGTLNLVGNDNFYTGNTIINGGTLAISNPGSLGNGTTTVDLNNGGTLTLNYGGISGNAFTNTIVLGVGGGVLDGLPSGGDISINGLITGGTGLTIAGADVIPISNTVDDVGSLTITAGRLLLLGNSGTLGLFGNNATVQVDTNLDFGIGGTASLDNAITFAQNTFLEQRNNTTVVLTNVTLPSGGTFTIGADDVQNGGSFVLSNTSGTMATLTSDLTIVTNNVNDPVTLGSAITGNGGLIVQATGLLTLGGTNTYTGSTQIQNGTMVISSTGTLPSTSAVTLGTNTTDATLVLGDSSGGVNQTIAGLTAGTNNPNNDFVINGGSAESTLTIDNSTADTYNGFIGNNGGGNQNLIALTKSGSGTLTLANNNTFTGAVTVQNGTLAFNFIGADGNAQPLGENTGVITLGDGALDNGTLDYTGGSNTFDRNVTVTSGSAGTISNTGGGLLTLSGTLTKANSTLTLSGGSFDVTGQITGGTPSDFNSDLVINGGATVTLDNSNDNYTGPTSVYGGSTLKDGVGTLPSGTVLTLGDSSDGAVANTYDLNGDNQSIAALDSISHGGNSNTVTNNGGGAVTLTLTGLNSDNSPASSTFNGIIEDGTSTIAMSITGGTHTLSGANTYSGGTTVTNGTLQVDNTSGSGTGTGNVLVNSGSILSGTGIIAPDASHGVTIADGAQLIPGGAPVGSQANGSLTLTSAAEATVPVLTLASPASPTTPAQLTFDLGTGVNGITHAGATLDAGALTLAGSSTYIQLTIDAAGEVVFSAGDNPTLINLDPLGTLAKGDYLLFAGGQDSDYLNLSYDPITGLINGGLAIGLDPDGATGQLFLKDGNIYVDYQPFDSVPEPETWAMLLMGLALLGGAYYRSRRAAKV